MQPTEEEIETISEVSNTLNKREKRKGKLKQDKFGRYHIRFRDNRRSKEVYHIEAPNNVFFNEDLE